MKATRLVAIVGLALALVAAPLTAGAQQRPVPRIGILAGQPSSDLLPPLDQFREELRKLGWIEGQTVTVLELRSAEGRNERLPGLAAEVLKADPRVIVVFSAPATRVLQQATATIPIVMWGVEILSSTGWWPASRSPGGT